MLDEKEVIRRVSGVTRVRLQTWVSRGWVLPAMTSDGPNYSEIDIARCDLIRELRDDLEIDHDAVEIVLSLLDQVYGLRRELRAVMGAVKVQPDEVRVRILGALSDDSPEGKEND